MILSFEIIDRMLALDPTPWFEKLWPYEEYSKQQFINQLKPSIKEGEVIKPATSLLDYAGEYQNDAYGNIIVKHKNDKLYIDYINSSELYHYDQDIFEAYQLYKYYQFKFIRDQKGKVIEIRCQFEPAVADIVFNKDAE